VANAGTDPQKPSTGTKIRSLQGLAYRKNPTTERRVSRENASEHHVVQEVPSLRIVDDALWQRVKTRQEDWGTS
jgi:hypothetical protein